MKVNIADWPKIELHYHIEGCIRIETFIEIIKSRGIEFPGKSYEDIKKQLRLDDDDKGNFTQGLGKINAMRVALCDKDAITRITYEAIEDAANDNVKYLELRLSPAPLMQMGLADKELMDGLEEGMRLGEKNHDIKVGLIVGITRQFEKEWADRVTDFAVKYMDRGICGFDVLANEIGYPPELFTEHYKRAAEAGLHLTAHAAEMSGCGSDNILKSIELLHAKRIGHGAHMFDDPELRAAKAVLDNDVLVECCITSNFVSGSLPSIKGHPIRRMYDMGMAVSVNSDDPRIMGTSTNKEYNVALHEVGFTTQEIQDIILRSLDYIFRPELKSELRKKFVFPNI